MTGPKRLTSPDNPHVKATVALLRHRGRRKAKRFVAEGIRQVTRAAEAGLTLRQLYLCPDLLGERLQDLSAALARACQPPSYDQYEVTVALLRKMAYRQSSAEGVLAVFDQPIWHLEALDIPENGLWLIAVGITKPGNLGAMARSVEAAAASALIIADAHVDPFNPNAICASTGAVFSLPILCADTASIIKWITQRNIRLFAATPQARLTYDQADLTGPTAFAVGAEDTGLDSRWLAAADSSGGHLAIPMLGRRVDSLNASVAAAVLLFEAVRQRHSHTTR